MLAKGWCSAMRSSWQTLDIKRVLNEVFHPHSGVVWRLDHPVCDQLFITFEVLYFNNEISGNIIFLKNSNTGCCRLLANSLLYLIPLGLSIGP